ncbi:MAG: hypothetical protein GY861_25150 [bacterium]|nr:hypothetical protein [bacterium]
MISKWFIGVNAKSKGYFKYFGGGYGYYANEIKAKPCFTKQTALAPSCDTEKDALAEIDKLDKTAKKDLATAITGIKDNARLASGYPTLTFDEKVDILTKYNMCIQYDDPNYAWGSRSIYFNGRQNTRNQTYNELQVKAIEDYVWNGKTNWDNVKLRAESEIKYIKDKLIVRECDLEFKFMDSEKRSIKWDMRKSDETAGSYCNACGGAVPDVPQLVIYGGKETHRICAICMTKLSHEAQIQSKKISPDILEHYNTDRFLISMD